MYRSFEIILETGTVHWIELQIQRFIPGVCNHAKVPGQMHITRLVQGPQLPMSSSAG